MSVVLFCKEVHVIRTSPYQPDLCLPFFVRSVLFKSCLELDLDLICGRKVAIQIMTILIQVDDQLISTQFYNWSFRGEGFYNRAQMEMGHGIVRKLEPGSSNCNNWPYCIIQMPKLLWSDIFQASNFLFGISYFHFVLFSHSWIVGFFFLQADVIYVVLEIPSIFARITRNWGIRKYTFFLLIKGDILLFSLL